MPLLDESDFFEIPEFINPIEVSLLRDLAFSLHAENKFRAARIGSSKQLEKNIRSDEICWLDESFSPLTKSYFAKLDALKTLLNEKYFLGLKTHETHFAIYQPGDFYQRHLDANEKSDRKISLICYLNSEWRQEDGGMLRLYIEGGDNDIAPTGGKLVGFISDQVEHEVLPAYRERISLTSWFLDR